MPYGLRHRMRDVAIGGAVPLSENRGLAAKGRGVCAWMLRTAGL